MSKTRSYNSGLRTQHSALFYWAPPILWMAAIFFFSTDIFSGENTGGVLRSIFHSIFPGLTEEQFRPIHSRIRKAAHLTEYGILALLLFRAFRSGAGIGWHWSWAIYSLMIIVPYALLDEFHQTLTKARVGSPKDSLIDVSGGVIALMLLWLARKKAS
jgi:VanZ family protein